MSPAGRPASPVARYRLVNAWPSKVAAGLARAGHGTTVAMETNPLAVAPLLTASGSAPPPAQHRSADQPGTAFHPLLPGFPPRIGTSPPHHSLSPNHPAPPPRPPGT